MHTMRHYRIAAIPADGIGPEVIAAGLEVLDAVAARDGELGMTACPPLALILSRKWSAS